jgi:hypothetical protein
MCSLGTDLTCISFFSLLQEIRGIYKTRNRFWVWTVRNPTSKLLVVVEVGTRTLAMAQRVVHQVTQVLAPHCMPLFLTDGLKDYGTAILTHCGQWRQPERRQDKGPRPKPRWLPLPELL